MARKSMGSAFAGRWAAVWALAVCLPAGLGGAWANTSAVKARPDSATVAAGKRVTIDVLANDRGVQAGQARVRIVQRPKRGVAFVRKDGRILYEAPANFKGTETFVYRVRDPNGRKSTATVTVKVRCRACSAPPRALQLSWQPAVGPVNHYEVLFGTRPDNTEVPVATKAHGREGRQVVRLELGAEVPAEPGDQVCFRVRAVARSGAASVSDAACKVIR